MIQLYKSTILGRVKTIYYISFCILLVLIAVSPSYSQIDKLHKQHQEFGCANEELSEEEYETYRRLVEAERATDKSIYRSPVTRYVPLVFHIVRSTDGEGVTIEEAEQQLKWANAKFEPANIQFYQCSPPNIVVSDFWYDTTFIYTWVNNCDADNVEYDFDAEFHIPNVANVYLVNTDGMSWASRPEKRESHCWDWVVYNQGSINNRWLFAHELGHYLGLVHTFQNTNENWTRYPLSNCFNCLTEGDMLCDTPADHHSSSDDWLDGCMPVHMLDDCGMPLIPNGRNLMSYSNSACPADEKFFTQGQCDRMNYRLTTERDYLNCTSDCVYDYSLNGQHNTTHTYRTWEDIQSTADVNSGVSVYYEAENYISLLPGFHAEQGSRFTASIKNCVDDSNDYGSDAVESLKQIESDFEITSNHSFKAYPSPFTENITVEYYSKQNQSATLSIFSVTGQELIHQDIKPAEMEGLHFVAHINLEANNLLPGIYFVALRVKDEVNSIKLVKM